ncbi:MAG: Peptide deformylase [Chlamydiia bacterium]|nr:Peptide deformylase [Chlamydiia bacterium]MCH9615809.1 Peptide deformylase [Chlamydiia bacterium]MCH9628788.1 Peptide deformylase [Chlamydiia bacterium]
MIRDLVYYGDKRLRTKCELVGEITPEIKELAQDLLDSMRAHNGAGLAAPQVGVLLRMFTMCYVGTDDEGWPIIGEPRVIINPKIVKYSDEVWTTDEGCLSLPKLRGEVERPSNITIEAIDLEGNPYTWEIDDAWVARCFLHELDHLNGVLYIDRMTKGEKKRLDPDLKALKKKYSK